jgi:hypothetical protein
VFPFIAGAAGKGIDAVVVAPANAGFFALGLALLQGILDPTTSCRRTSSPRRSSTSPRRSGTRTSRASRSWCTTAAGLHELFSYNLYPGPSAKKGIYGVLLNLGEARGWVTAHCSTVQVVTPYDNKRHIMHEGASGGGKSEMLEHIAPRARRRCCSASNLVTGDERTSCCRAPASCGRSPTTWRCATRRCNRNDGQADLMDAEDAWFVRVNHITHYGTDPHLERLTAIPPEPLLFLNIDACPAARR